MSERAANIVIRFPICFRSLHAQRIFPRSNNAAKGAHQSARQIDTWVFCMVIRKTSDNYNYLPMIGIGARRTCAHNKVNDSILITIASYSVADTKAVSSHSLNLYKGLVKFSLLVIPESLVFASHYRLTELVVSSQLSSFNKLALF